MTNDLHISAGGYEATVHTIGAALGSLRFSGREFLDSFERPEENPVARGQVLVPFPNRVANGEYIFDGRKLRLPVDEPDRGHAIHGLARWREWTVSEYGEASIALECEIPPGTGYPFSLELGITYEVSPSGLAVRTMATNTGDGPLPFGAGYHPYLTVGTEFVDEAILNVPARTRLELDARLIPTGSVSVAGSDFDFRGGREIGDTRINACFTDLDFDPDGLMRVTLSRADGTSIEVWADERHPFFQIYTGDEIPDESRRRRSVAIEPMTCAPDAFNSGDGLVVLHPGESFVGEWGITAR